MFVQFMVNCQFSFAATVSGIQTVGTELLRNLRQLLEPLTVKSNSLVGVRFIWLGITIDAVYVIVKTQTTSTIADKLKIIFLFILTFISDELAITLPSDDTEFLL